MTESRDGNPWGPGKEPASMAKSSNDDDFPLDEGEAAKLIGSARPTLAKMRREGRGPEFFKLGERVRYLRGAVLKWRAEQAGAGRGGVV